MDEKRIFLARHGQTFHNAAAGESYIDADRLSETGWEQARRLGRLLAARDIRTVVTSPLARARETAEAVNETLGCPLEEDERLIEIVPPVHEDDEPEREVEVATFDQRMREREVSRKTRPMREREVSRKTRDRKSV